MGWYEEAFKGQAGTGQDYSNFNFDAEQDKIKRKRALAAQLQQQSAQSPKGEFFRSGDFTGYAGGATKGAVLAQLAQAALAAYAGQSADADQAKLSQDSLAALQANMDNKPWEQRLNEPKLPDAPALAESGMSPPVSADVQASPVREQPPSTARPLSTNPDGSPVRPGLGAAVAGPGSVPAAGGPAAFIGNGDFKALSTPKSNLTPDMVKAASARLGEKLSAGDISALSLLGSPTSKPATAPVPAAAPGPLPTQPRTALPPVNAGEPSALPSAMPVAQPPAQPAPQPAAQPPAAQSPTMAQQMAYLQRIANSGPMGQQAAQLIQQQMMAKPQLQHVNVKNDDGSEAVLAFDPSGRMKPQVVYQPQGSGGPTDKQLKRDEFAGKTFENFSKAQDELSTAQQQYSKVQNAREMLTRYAPTGGVFSSIYSGIAKALGNDQANALDMALKDLAFSDLRSTFGGNPTEGERKAQMDVKASVERGLAPSQGSLDVLAAGIERRMRNGQQQVDYWRGLNDQYRTRPQAQGDAGGMADALFPRR